MDELSARQEKQSYCWGGVASLLLAIGYVVTIPLYSWVGMPPAAGGEAWFHYLPGKTTVWWAILWLMVITDLLYLPVAWALWLALRKAAKNLMLASVACLALFVVLDLAVTWTAHASLLMLFQSYTSTGDEARRAACLAAADYASVAWTTPLLRFYVIVIPALGILFAGVAMLKANFAKITAFTGIVTGLLGVFSQTGFSPLIMSAAIGSTLWFLLVGLRLLRLSASPNPAQS
jgi:hypothetical protein